MGNKLAANSPESHLRLPNSGSGTVCATAGTRCSWNWSPCSPPSRDSLTPAPVLMRALIIQCTGPGRQYLICSSGHIHEEDDSLRQVKKGTWLNLYIYSSTLHLNPSVWERECDFSGLFFLIFTIDNYWYFKLKLLFKISANHCITRVFSDPSNSRGPSTGTRANRSDISGYFNWVSHTPLSSLRATSRELSDPPINPLVKFAVFQRQYKNDYVSFMQSNGVRAWLKW